MGDAVLRKVDVDWLLSIYGALLTDKQRAMAVLYYDEDLSLAEIAQQENVSRQCVHETLQRVERQLRTWEEKLCVRERLNRVEDELNLAIEALPQKGADQACVHMKKALRLLNDEEETNGL